LESEKAHLAGKFVIVEKLGGHVLHCLAFSLLKVVWQIGRQTKNLVFRQFFFLKFGIWQLVAIQLF